MKTELIAEIGINHHGNKIKAIELIKSAKESGCWGVKFQFRLKDFFATNDEMGSTLIREELEKSDLNIEWIPDLIKVAKEHELKIGFSFFRVNDLNFFISKQFDKIDFVKIPSAEFNNLELIKLSQEFCKVVMISYGGGYEEKIISSIKNSNLRETDVVFHCISNYPTHIGNQQLSFLKRLRNVSKASIGYSSHDKEWEVNLIAAKYNLKFIERHLCLNKEEKGLDISTSSNPLEFKKLSYFLGSYDEINKCDERYPNQGEILNVRNLGTSLYAKRDISAYEVVQENDLVEKSPSIGLTLTEFKQLSNKKSVRQIKKGDLIRINDFYSYTNKIDIKLINFANKNNISLPVRLHDFDFFQEKFKLNKFEFHFSYKEILQLKNQGFESLLSSINKNKSYSIHLPDYINKDSLIDPFADSSEVKNTSLDIIKTCVELSICIKKITGVNCLILGSFSINNFENKNTFYKKFKEFTSHYKDVYGVDIIAQWLPKKAWYFGGTIIVDLFSSEEDIESCLEHNIPICLDIAHLILSANFYKQDWRDWFNKLKPLCSHIHLSDASGTDGEGVEFGKGELENFKDILGLGQINVLEIWEGHLNDGEGFYKGLEYISKNL